ncbi:MAG: DUF3488 domain-containing transglutaminase family protein [Desulfuromonadaceae bacterium]|nr:DUF3488 domain-containing transglutaminase family protein [Desulfuromonadaceae bacterium]
MVRIKLPLDLLTYLVALLGLIPLFGWLDTPVQWTVAAAIAAGLSCDLRQHHWIGPRLATALTLVFFVFYLTQLNLNNVASPVVNLLTLLLSIRLITPKQGRHYLQIFVLSLFCLAGSSLLSLNILYLPALVLMIAGVTIGLVLLTFFHRDPSLRLNRPQLTTLLKTAAILPVGSLLLMVLLFAILPRTQYPLWDFLNPTNSATSGFSEEVRPGAFSSNQAVKTVAFRAECAPLPPEQLYWRGTVLNTVRRSTWIRTLPGEERTQWVEGQVVTCTITLPATNRTFLFSLDRPQSLREIVYRQQDDGVLTTPRPLAKGVRYQCQSHLGGMWQVRTAIDRDLYLAVPTDIAPRLTQLAAQIRQQGESDHQRIALLEKFFRQQQLNYATDDLPGPDAPIEEFLFDKKRGYCEFFASSFALLLRLCAVPCRLVGGYHGGEYNDLGGYYLITDDLAHVWVETLVENTWVRIDPSRFAANASSALMAPRQQGLPLYQRALDGLNYLWQKSVIGYDFNQQLELLKKGGHHLSHLNIPSEWLIRTAQWLFGVAGLILIGAWWIRRHRQTAQQKILMRYQKALRTRYQITSVPAAQGLIEHALQLGDPSCIAFARRYSHLLYGGKSFSDEQLRHLNRLIDQVRTRK